MDMFTFEIDMSNISSNFLYYMRSAELGEDDSYAACALYTPPYAAMKMNTALIFIHIISQWNVKRSTAMRARLCVGSTA